MSLKKSNPWLVTVALCAPIWMGAQECTTVIVGTKQTCKYDGKAYAVGDHFPSSDGCNSCGCESGGQVVCTAAACAPRTCSYEGAIYEEGEEFAASDGCNTCSCTGGRLACTDALCEPGCQHEGKHYELGQTFKKDCADCVCTDQGPACDDVVCPEPSGCRLGDASFPVGTTVMCQDGCNQCTCTASPQEPVWMTTLIGCPALRQIEVCEGTPDEAEAQAQPLYIDGHALALKLQFGGGCEEHSFRLCTDGAFRESSPVQVSLWVVDDGKPDPCDAALTQEHVFDLSPLEALYEASYPSGPNELSLTLNQGTARYAW